MQHIPVLLHEVITGLEVKPSDIFFDGTVGAGGHSKAVYEMLGENGMLVGTDLDGSAIEKAKAILSGGTAKVFLKQASFRNLDSVLAEAGVEGADKILLDLGLSSNQFEESGRGFTFQKDEPLLMTFRNKLEPSDLTAEDIVNRWDEENIAQVILSYGEERFARKIAAAIVAEREKGEIKTTFQLVDIIKRATPKGYQHKRLHPATKTFQALRITVNDEIGALKEAVQKGFASLRTNGRMAVISFHSLEDRLVKNFFKEQALSGLGRLITKKPIQASRAEAVANPRSRSAKLRIIEKL